MYKYGHGCCIKLVKGVSLMNLQVKFDFHNVGQGLFYSGKINDFNFVYDCGSKPVKELKKVIDIYKVENLKDNMIDVLVLSHFDYDHISGLDYLLDNVKVEYAIIPYYSPQEKLILAFKHPQSSETYFDFLFSPVNFLFERGVKNVILVRENEFTYEDSHYNIDDIYTIIK